MIRRLSQWLSHFAYRWVPDPLVLAILLTLLTMSWAYVSSPLDLSQLVEAWGGYITQPQTAGSKGIWSLLTFSMQMCLVLVTGYALAMAPPVRALINQLAKVPRTAGHAIALTAFMSMCAGLLNWGLGLIVGALLAREVGRACDERGLKVHYPLLGAAGYTGLLVWHGGLCGSMF